METKAEEPVQEGSAPDRKTCSRCGEEKDIDDFQPHYRTADGRMNICRVCHGRASHVETKKEKKTGPSKKNKNGSGNGKGNGSRNGSANRVVLVLEDYPAVAESLVEAAHREIRSVEHQAIAFIVRGLQEDESQGSQREG